MTWPEWPSCRRVKYTTDTEPQFRSFPPFEGRFRRMPTRASPEISLSSIY